MILFNRALLNHKLLPKRNHNKRPIGNEAKPQTPSNFKVARQKDRRNANLTWDAVKDATGYVIYWGIEKDKLNLNAMMYDYPDYELRALTTDQSYYLQVEAFNENGISQRSEIVFIE
ncbi:fibronectin type III domain-containing protein [Gelidibacter maritimus]|uniref:fibronectin type III domain-containing protein n=1 Tax=Gelidibacter maritimus TaxID=2761487 RepID=UPI001F2814B3|nr:fibronectin type III domain-containing protein [Gelidibacter maritimus]